MSSDADGERIDWDALEAAGHDFAMIAPLECGHSRYICEHCGAFLLLSAMRIEIWHHPHREDRTCEPRRGTGPLLSKKLLELMHRDLKRLEDV